MDRIQQVLEGANIKLSSVASNVVGVTGRAILEALIQGVSPTEMAELAKGKPRKKREQLAITLTGHVRPHHRFILTELLCQIDAPDETIVHLDAELQRYCDPFEEAMELLDTPFQESLIKRPSHRLRNWHRHESLPNGEPFRGLGGSATWERWKCGETPFA